MRTLGLLLLPTFLVAGCGEPLAPSDVAGTYVLRTVQGEPLPTVLHSTEHVSITVLADTLRLNADGTGLHSSVQTHLYATGETSDAPYPVESRIEFRVSDDRILISWICPLNALMACIAGPHMTAVRTPHGLRVEGAVTGRVPMEYEAVTPAEAAS